MIVCSLRNRNVKNQIYPNQRGKKMIPGNNKPLIDRYGREDDIGIADPERKSLGIPIPLDKSDSAVARIRPVKFDIGVIEFAGYHLKL